jgi:hypothetical protein
VVVRRRTIPKIGVSTLFSNEIKTGVSIDFFILLGNIFIGKEGTDPELEIKTAFYGILNLCKVSPPP